MRLHPLGLLQCAIVLLGTFAAAFQDLDATSPDAPSQQKQLALSFSACTKWLRSDDTYLFYPFGRNETTNGADALRQCLESDHAAAYRNKISDIYLVPPAAGLPNEDQVSLKRIIEQLPGPLDIWWPSRTPENKLWTHLDHQRRSTSSPASPPPTINRLSFYTGLTSHPTYVPRSTIPTLVECDGSPPHLTARLAGTLDPLFPLFAHLAACPDVRSLDVAIYDSGCVVGDEARGFPFGGADVFPARALENLTLAGYRWDEGGAGGVDGAAAWRAAVDWTALRRLDVDVPEASFLAAFGGPRALPRLEALALRPRYGWGEAALCVWESDRAGARANLTGFVAGLEPLRELVVDGVGEELLPLERILGVHGGTLKRLGMHEFERDCAGLSLGVGWTRPVMGVRELRLIREMAPGLEALEVDLGRGEEGGLPIEELEALAGFGNGLREVTLHFTIVDARTEDGCCIETDYDVLRCTKKELVEPKIGLAAVQRMISILRGKRRPEQRGIEKVKVAVGDYGRRNSGYVIDPSPPPDRPVLYDCDFFHPSGDVACALSYWDCYEEDDCVVPAEEGDFYFNAEDVRHEQRRDEL